MDLRDNVTLEFKKNRIFYVEDSWLLSQELYDDGGDTESDGDLTKPIATHLSTSPCPCARLRRAESERDSKLLLTLITCFKQSNTFSAISATQRP